MARTTIREVNSSDKSATGGYTLRGVNAQAFLCREPEYILSGPSDTGKTVASCVKMHILCLKYKGCQGGMMRKTYASLRESVVQTMNKVITHQPVQILGGDHPTAYQYHNGSRIWLGGMDNSDRILSSEKDFIYVNQAEELTENDWEILTTRCSGRGAVVKSPQLFGDCNPSRATHWIRDRFKKGKLVLFASTHKDNPSLYTAEGVLLDTPDAKRRMATLDNLSGMRRSRLKDGLWVSAEGLVYDMFNPEIHVRKRDPGEMKQWYLALDEGYQNPWVILDIGEDSDGRWHVFQEYYERRILQWVVVQQAKDWAKEHFRSDVAVDAAAASFIADLNSYGMAATGGKGRVLDGIYAIQNRLAVQGDGRPRLTIDPGCVNTINEFESYVWRPEKDQPVKENDHAMDALRYLADVKGEVSGAFDVAAVKESTPRAEVSAGSTSAAQELGLTLNDLDLKIDM